MFSLTKEQSVNEVQVKLVFTDNNIIISYGFLKGPVGVVIVTSMYR